MLRQASIMNIVAEKNATEVYVSLTDRQKDRQTHNGKTLYPLFHQSGGIITFSKKIYIVHLHGNVILD